MPETRTESRTLAVSSWVDKDGTKWSKQAQAHQLATPMPARCISRIRKSNLTSPDGTYRRCKKAPMEGQRVCRLHGGRTSNSMTMAVQRNQLSLAVETLRKLGIPVPPAERIDPREVLLDAVQKSYAIKQALEYLLTEFTEEELALVGKMKEVTLKGSEYIQQLPEGKSIEIQRRISMYNDALDRCAKISSLAVRAGVEERMVRLAERQSDIIVSVIRAAVAFLPPDLQYQVVQNAASEMRMLVARPVNVPRPQLVAAVAAEAAPHAPSHASLPDEPTDEDSAP